MRVLLASRRRKATAFAAALVATVGIVLTVATLGFAGPQLNATQRVLLNEAKAVFERAWVLTAPGVGGYVVDSSSMPPSLYETSWTVQLLARTGELPDGLDRVAVIGAMNAAITHPESHGVPALEAIWLALQTIHAFGQPLPSKAVASTLPAYLTPSGLYALEPGGEPSWGATSIATRTLALIGSPIPDITIQRVAEGIEAEGTPSAMEPLLNEDIPLWEAADAAVPTAARSSLMYKVDAISSYLESWLRANSGYAGGELVGAVASLADIASANGAGAPPVIDMSHVLDGLRTPNGGFAAGSGTFTPDPHTTFDAVRLGAPSSDVGAGYFEARAQSDGWTDPQDQVDPCSSFMGLLVGRSAGVHNKDQALAATTTRWISELTTQPEVSASALCILGLGDLLGVQPPQQLVDEMRSAVLDPPGGSSPAPAVLRIRILLALRLPLPQSSEWVPLESGVPDGPAQDIGTYETCVALRELLERSGDCLLASGLRLDDGTYRGSISAGAADLRSTTVALEASTSIDVRLAAANRFRGGGATWMLPVGTTSNVNSLYSAFLSLVLADVIHDPAFL